MVTSSPGVAVARVLVGAADRQSLTVSAVAQVLRDHHVGDVAVTRKRPRLLTPMWVD